MNNLSETLWKNYTTVNEWIRFSDTKAAAILALNGVLIGLILSNVGTYKSFLSTHLVILILLLLAVVLEAISTYFCIRCIHPSLRFGDPKSLIYFSHIAVAYEDGKAYRLAISKAFKEEHKIIDDLSQQVWVNSRLAHKKYVSIAWSIRFLICSLIIGFAGVAFILMGKVLSYAK